MWNYGSTSKIISIAPKGRKMLQWEEETKDGKVWPRTVKAERLVACAEAHVR